MATLAEEASKKAEIELGVLKNERKKRKKVASRKKKKDRRKEETDEQTRGCEELILQTLQGLRPPSGPALPKSPMRPQASYSSG